MARAVGRPKVETKAVAKRGVRRSRVPVDRLSVNAVVTGRTSCEGGRSQTLGVAAQVDAPSSPSATATRCSTPTRPPAFSPRSEESQTAHIRRLLSIGAAAPAARGTADIRSCGKLIPVGEFAHPWISGSGVWDSPDDAGGARP